MDLQQPQVIKEWSTKLNFAVTDSKTLSLLLDPRNRSGPLPLYDVTIAREIDYFLVQ